MSKKYNFSNNHLGVIRESDGQYISFSDADPNKPWLDEQLADGNLPGPTQLTPADLQEQHKDAPITALTRALEWFEDSRVGLPQLVDGAWLRPVEAIDLRVPDNLAVLKDRLKSKLADVRYQHEVGGVTINGALVKTDRESQATITGAYARASVNPATTVSWKADNGFVVIDAAEIMFFGDAVFSHVQGCFDRERHFNELIDAAETVDTLTGIDITEGWGA